MTKTKEMTFTTLAELKGFLCGLNESDLTAITNSHDWYEIRIEKGFNGAMFYSIHPEGLTEMKRDCTHYDEHEVFIGNP